MIIFVLPCIAAIVGLIIWWGRLREKKKKKDEISGKIACLRAELDADRIRYDETKKKWDVLKREVVAQPGVPKEIG